MKRINLTESQFKILVQPKSSSQFILEYLDSKHNMKLLDYFKDDDEESCAWKAEDLATNFSDCIIPYVKDIIEDHPEFSELLNGNSSNYIDEKSVRRFIDLLYENGLNQDFVKYMKKYGPYEELPSWAFMDYVGIVKNEWCIHFTKDADNIAQKGFSSGTKDIEQLAYTKRKNIGGEGYNFAFLIGDASVDYNEYGNQAVIFKTSGVEIYHDGDNESQVVFWGPYAHDFIPIKRKGEKWVIYGRNGRILYSADTPSQIAFWATNNLEQYRKQILYDNHEPIRKTKFVNDNDPSEEYEYKIGDFHCGLALVKRYKYGDWLRGCNYVDKKNRLLLPQWVTDAEPFIDKIKMARVYDEVKAGNNYYSYYSSYFFIDTKGNFYVLNKEHGDEIPLPKTEDLPYLYDVKVPSPLNFKSDEEKKQYYQHLAKLKS